MKASDFTFEKYIGKMGYSLNQVWNARTNRPMSGYTELGRVPANALRVRPRSSGEAVMLCSEEHQEDLWLHVKSDEEAGMGSIGEEFGK